MDISNRIEHTVLGPTTTMDNIRNVLLVASEKNMRACIPPCYVKDAKQEYPDVLISTVVGFPHGQTESTVKAMEAEQAVKDGADEIDMVANIGFLRSHDFEKLKADIETVVASVTVPVKVIIETPLLTDEEKHHICEIAVECGADFVKTATGFSNGGATVEDVQLMSDYLPVKASGGIGSGEKARAMFEAGAERIGASSGDVIVDEMTD